MSIINHLLFGFSGLAAGAGIRCLSDSVSSLCLKQDRSAWGALETGFYGISAFGLGHCSQLMYGNLALSCGVVCGILTPSPFRPQGRKQLICQKLFLLAFVGLAVYAFKARLAPSLTILEGLGACCTAISALCVISEKKDNTQG